MKLSFSTRGWAHLSWEEWLSAGTDLGFEGVEVYNLPKFPELMERSGPFHKYNMAATVRQLREKNLAIPCFDTSCDLSSNEENFVPAMKELIQAAKHMQVPYVVIVALNENEELVYKRLNELIPAAKDADVAILIKTSGIYSNTARLRALLDSFACDQLAALWDMHHPYRDFHESADTTIKNLGAYVKTLPPA